LHLIENGWTVKGYLNESPYVNPDIFLKYYGEGYFKQGTIWYITYQFLQLWGDLTRFGTKSGIYGAIEMAWFSELLPITGISPSGMIHCTTDTRGGPIENHCIEYWNYFEKFCSKDAVREEFFGGENNMELFNFDTHDYFYLGLFKTMWTTNKDTYNKLLNLPNFKMLILQGKFDPFYTIQNQLEWINGLAYAKKGFTDENWTKVGTRKDVVIFKNSGNLCFRTTNTGHIPQLWDNQNSFELLKGMIEKNQTEDWC
jgi:hypothetical protein